MPRQEASRRLDIRKTYKNLKFFNAFWPPPKANMRPLGRGFGVVLGPLGRSWGPLGPQVGPMLEALERLGALLGDLGAILGRWGTDF